MGLDISHGAWHGAYSAFMRWREMIAEIIQIPPLELMEGFFEKGGYRDPISDFAKNCPNLAEVIYRSLPIKWECLRPDPLYVLLHHSDCDGEISPEDCAAIADRLEEILPKFPTGEGGGHIGNWRDKTSTFIDGCRAAAKANEPLDFH